MADSTKYDLVEEKKQHNERKNKIIKIVVAVVVVIVVFVIGILIGYFSRKPERREDSGGSLAYISHRKAEQHKMFLDNINTEKLEDNVR